MKIIQKSFGEFLQTKCQQWAPKEFKLEKTFFIWYNQFSAAGKFGSGAIMDRMAKIKENNKIYLNHEVIDFKYDDNKITSILFKNGKEKIKDEIIISTLPINLTAKKLGYNSKLQFNSYILCYVIVNTKTEVLLKILTQFILLMIIVIYRVTEQRKYLMRITENKTVMF